MRKSPAYSPYYTHTLAVLELDVLKELVDYRIEVLSNLVNFYEASPELPKIHAARISKSKFELTVLNAITESIRVALAEASDGGRVELRISRRKELDK